MELLFNRRVKNGDLGKFLPGTLWKIFENFLIIYMSLREIRERVHAVIHMESAKVKNR